LKVSPVLQHPVLIFSFPYLIILIFSYAGDQFDKKKTLLLTAFLALGILSTTFTNNYYSKQHFGEFKDIARLTAKWQKQYGDSAITKVISINSPMYIDFYLDRYQAKARFEMYDINGTEGLKKLSEVVRNSRSQYFLYAISKPSPVEGEDIIRSRFPYLIDNHDYESYSSVALFARDKGKTWEQANDLTLIKSYQSSLNKDAVPVNLSVLKESAHWMDSTSEYSPGIEINLDDINGIKKGTKVILQAETDLLTLNNSGGSALVISIETAQGESLQWKGAVSEYVETPGKWCHIINTLKINSGFPKGAKLKVYFWNKDKKTLYLRNLNLKVFQ
jgi:hypothetical protein